MPESDLRKCPACIFHNLTVPAIVALNLQTFEAKEISRVSNEIEFRTLRRYFNRAVFSFRFFFLFYRPTLQHSTECAKQEKRVNTEHEGTTVKSKVERKKYEFKLKNKTFCARRTSSRVVRPGPQ